MPDPVLVLMLLAMASIAASMFIARAIWPRFKALETRGVIRKPVPDLMGGQRNSLRTLGLLWFTPIPSDRPQLKRMVMAYRASQIVAVLLMFAAAVTAGSLDGDPTSPAHKSGTPPPVTLSVQDH